MLNLPPFCPELNPIELMFQLLRRRLRHSNTRYLSHQIKSKEFFFFKCVEVLQNTSDEDIRKNYRICGYIGLLLNVCYRFSINGNGIKNDLFIAISLYQTTLDHK